MPKEKDVDNLVAEVSNIDRAKDLREKQGLSFEEISERTGVDLDTIKEWSEINNWGLLPIEEAKLLSDPSDPRVQKIEELERKLQAIKAEKSRIGRSYRNLQDKYNTLTTQVGLVKDIGLPIIDPIKKKKPSGTTEATAVIVLSDWHFEEEVTPESVNMLNEYNLDIARARAEKCFQAGLRLTEIVARDVKVTTILLPLLGDFITNDIHEEFRDINQLMPMEALEVVQDSLASGINFLLKKSKYNIVIPCHSGNHARTTKKSFISVEHGHSLEYFMYRNLAKLFANEPRITFNIAKSYHSYQDVFGLTLRFHHGHGIRYYGGVGGIYIPANKAIAQWNKARHADIDVFSHYHQLKDGGSFITNGSLIGYNAYGLSLKADYEPPRQAFFVIDSKRGKTFTCPIRVS